MENVLINLKLIFRVDYYHIRVLFMHQQQLNGIESLRVRVKYRYELMRTYMRVSFRI